jgi:ATP-dependent DNA helicase RecG
MRPEILNRLFAPTTSLSGVGPRVAKLIEQVAGTKMADLLWHLPVGIIDRRYAPKVADARPGTVATMTLTVDEHRPPHNPRQPYKVICSDDSGSLTLVFFHARTDYLRQRLPVGEIRVISGKSRSLTPTTWERWPKSSSCGRWSRFIA